MGPTVTEAAQALAAGRLVVYPTDTLLGLGAKATDRTAVERVGRAKGRSSRQVVSIAVSSAEEVEAWAELSIESRAWARRHLPGPYTLLVRPTPRARQTFGPSILAPGGRLGVRLPNHPVARELARRIGPLTATSANLHGRPPCRSVSDAQRELGAAVAVYLPAVPKPSGSPSVVIDLSGDRPAVVPRG
ncbi:MAG: threonylcarbamoyl-AMP synthase [Thermoplasmata archaeon]|nr:threonylcarbamoyl-AMP synthase [Thermoplasmata archaeon]